MEIKSKIFFHRYWWLYYILFFLLLGLIIFILINFNQFGMVNKKLNNITDRLDSCDCGIRAPNQALDTAPSQNPYDAQDGCLSFTLSWETLDDLDLWVIDPDGNRIWFERYCKRKDNAFSSAGGQLDVDMNVQNKVNNAIENVFFKCSNTSPQNGIYRVYVARWDLSSGASVSVPFVLKVKEKGVQKNQVTSTVINYRREKFILSYTFNKE
jgi:hypothetical protein